MTKALTDPKIPTGIYNIASESVHLPSYIKERYNWEGEVVESFSLGYYPEVVFDTTKAKAVGLV